MSKKAEEKETRSNGGKEAKKKAGMSTETIRRPTDDPGT